MLNFSFADCNYTCHAKCRSLVTLDCKTADSTLSSCHDLVVTSSSNLKMSTENDDIVEVFIVLYCVFKVLNYYLEIQRHK